jgi:hypothetical protein
MHNFKYRYKLARSKQTLHFLQQIKMKKYDFQLNEIFALSLFAETLLNCEKLEKKKKKNSICNQTQQKWQSMSTIYFFGVYSDQ